MPLAEGQALARAIGCRFIETSAKSRVNIEEAFYETVREIRRYNRDMSNYPSGVPRDGAPTSRIEVDDLDKGAGCCGGCAVM